MLFTNDYTTENYESQVKKIFEKLYVKKKYNENVVEWLFNEGEYDKANIISSCASNIGITNIDNIAHIVKADFCRERICNVCAWRRQIRFMSQMQPITDVIHQQGYKFIFATLTIKNTNFDSLEKTVNSLLKGYYNLYRKTRIKKAWKGICRSLEVTYNAKDDTFHPHLHLLIAVDKDYFVNSTKYISQDFLCSMWGDILCLDYEPVVHIEKVDDTCKASLETIKYCLKPSQAEQALKAFFYVLKGRRLISFNGVFSKIRKELKYSDFENVLTDADAVKDKKRIEYSLYKFDASGGVYKFYNQYTIER